MERGHKIEEERLLSNSNETEVEETEKDQEEKEEYEALSLCDLPIEKEIRQSKKETQQENTSNQDEFDFCSFSKESEMCSPDQIFFQGQILPFRHSISNITTENRRLSRSESMDTYHSNGFTSCGSSRSSSIRSHQSSTSSGGSSSVTTPIYKPRVRNNFNSHPSPKPQMKYSRIKKQNMPNSNQKSTVWSLFRLGIVSTPEIVLEDLKNRSINNRNKDFQKSKSFDSTRFMSEKKKKKQGIFEVNGSLFSSCKCSSNDIIPSRIGTTKRSDSGKDVFAHEGRKGTKQQEEGKQSISSHRTFEWLKQISLDRTSSVRNDA